MKGLNVDDTEDDGTAGGINKGAEEIDEEKEKKPLDIKPGSSRSSRSIYATATNRGRGGGRVKIKKKITVMNIY